MSAGHSHRQKAQAQDTGTFGNLHQSLRTMEADSTEKSGA